MHRTRTVKVFSFSSLSSFAFFCSPRVACIYRTLISIRSHVISTRVHVIALLVIHMFANYDELQARTSLSTFYLSDLLKESE